MNTIIYGVTVITANAAFDVIKDGAVAFEDGVITYVGPTPDEEARAAYDEAIDGRGGVVLPGLINTHGHAAMALLRGYADDLPLQAWLEEKMWPLEARFTAEHVRWGSLLAIAEMLKTGTTTFVDMYDHMGEVARNVEETGIRAVLCRGVIGLCPREVQVAKLEEAKAFARTYRGAAGGRITTMMAPHAPYTCPPDYIREIVDAAAELDVPVHIHLSETVREVEQNVRDYGVRPVEHLRRLGVFDRPTLVAHAVHLTDEEIAVLAEYDVKVSHNPGSNLKLASGIAPVPKLLANGVTVSLGTDSAASNNNLDLFEEMRLAALIHKGHTQDPLAVPAAEALKMATIYGADAVFQRDRIGSLEVGKRADLVLLDAREPHWHPHYDPVSHVVYAARSADVRRVYVDGRLVVEDGTCVTIDEERVRYEAARLATELTGRTLF